MPSRVQRTAVLAAWCFLGWISVSATHAQTIELAAPVCALPPAPPDPSYASVAPPAAFRAWQAGKNSGIQAAIFNINFLAAGTTDAFGRSCTNWPQAARDAFQHAANIWGSMIESSVPIPVEACWTEDLPISTLGSAGPNQTWFDAGNANIIGVQKETWYPISLVNATYGSDIFDGAPNILAAFNANRTDWTFRTDGVAETDKLDFVTVVLHEFGHGLGFTGMMDYDNGSGTAECDGVSEKGCYDLSGNGYPAIYDRFTEDASGTALLNTASYPNPSKQLGAALTTPSNARFTGSATGTMLVHTPESWNGGSSYSHFDLNTYPNELMKPKLPSGQALHDPGASLAVMQDMGWSVTALPVELVSFKATTAGTDVQLSWRTASETGSLGFEVEHRYLDDAFKRVAFVESAGTTSEPQAYQHQVGDLAPGQHVFRLRQVDTDGTFAYSQAVEVTIGLEEQPALAVVYPNPFNPQTTLTLTLAQPQQVRVEVFDALGRHVAVLHEGKLSANTAHRFTFDGSGRASGIYFIQSVGEQFGQISRAVTLVK
ncbi:MAG: T9SS type A sorting domain-containing protein [Rhodothermales bacterium]